MNFYASRSTIDTGLQTILNETTPPTDEGGAPIIQQIVQKDVTINSAWAPV